MEASRTVEDVFDNFSARRDGLIKALTTGTTSFTIRRRFTPKKPRFIPQTSRTSTRSGDGAEALDVMKRDEIHVALVDLHMPQPHHLLQ